MGATLTAVDGLDRQRGFQFKLHDHVIDVLAPGADEVEPRRVLPLSEAPCVAARQVHREAIDQVGDGLPWKVELQRECQDRVAYLRRRVRPGVDRTERDYQRTLADPRPSFVTERRGRAAR